MLFRAQGAQVAVVGPDKKVQLRPINIGKDYGTSLEILGGVTASDLIIVNPPDSLEDGQVVNVVAPSQPKSQNPSNLSPSNPNLANPNSANQGASQGKGNAQ